MAEEPPGRSGVPPVLEQDVEHGAILVDGPPQESREDSHPHLCDDCKARAIEAERQAEQAEHERQEQERQEAETAQASKAGGWLGRWRS